MEHPQEPRWLTAEEMESWLALVSVLIKLPAALDAQLLRDAGISHFEYQVLAGLSMTPERTMRMSDLAVISEGSLSRLSHVVNRLEKRGWVRRAPDPEDGRYTLAILTGEGWDKVVETAPGHVEAVRGFVFDALTKAQIRQLREIGRRITHAIDPGDGCLDRHPATARPEPDPDRHPATTRPEPDPDPIPDREPS
ncbi:MarR family winged helix-turn-helix transcriptional regulator [Nonomuraea angiospora]|uniref:MarR family winged helix-turn-helix transcriptional regulator n=1 Tax=Nonomuraea angiospora TaxID=46172 RepID=UPI0029B553C3|nr:MarR family transcriptional regulator [Nonomuraea angiospora]MDX3104185.1 MarR family transcriptional regulator [Nonomuraea angiospora]